MAEAAPARRVAEVVLLVPILRAGLGMVQAVQEVVPLTEVAHVGLRRDEHTLRSDVYLDRVPRDLQRPAGDRLRSHAGHGRLAGAGLRPGGRRGAAEVVALCIIASEPGLAAFRAAHPDVRVYCAAVDPGLNDVGFIVPGLGDAGDRLFGPPD